MNIFATSRCPSASAKFLDDKRVVKMVLESTQMLCTALNEISGTRVARYRSSHTGHPCALWARESCGNFEWLLEHAFVLSSEYTKRYGKIHRCQEVLEEISHTGYQHLFKKKDLTPFPNCTTYKGYSDVHMAYQLYLNDKWESDKRVPRWYGESF